MKVIQPCNRVHEYLSIDDNYGSTIDIPTQLTKKQVRIVLKKVTSAYRSRDDDQSTSDDNNSLFASRKGHRFEDLPPEVQAAIKEKNEHQHHVEIIPHDICEEISRRFEIRLRTNGNNQFTFDVPANELKRLLGENILLRKVNEDQREQIIALLSEKMSLQAQVQELLRELGNAQRLLRQNEKVIDDLKKTLADAAWNRIDEETVKRMNEKELAARSMYLESEEQRVGLLMRKLRAMQEELELQEKELERKEEEFETQFEEFDAYVEEMSQKIREQKLELQKQEKEIAMVSRENKIERAKLRKKEGQSNRKTSKTMLQEIHTKTVKEDTWTRKIIDSIPTGIGSKIGYAFIGGLIIFIWSKLPDTYSYISNMFNNTNDSNAINRKIDEADGKQ